MSRKNLFGQFIQMELQRLGMSVREFASYVGVAHTTISRAMDYDPPQPSLSFLEKLAQATDTDICTILALAAPDSQTDIDAHALMLAQQITKLSESQREFIENYLFEVAQMTDNQTNDV